ncbi:MAG: hypothetical protein ACTSUQ_14545 [Candidatus Freyarchaeota archaeon]
MELIDKLLIPDWRVRKILDKKLVQKASKAIKARVAKVTKETDSATLKLTTGPSIKSLGADFLVKLKNTKKGAVVEVRGEPKIDLENPRLLVEAGQTLLERIQKLCK